MQFVRDRIDKQHFTPLNINNNALLCLQFIFPMGCGYLTVRKYGSIAHCNANVQSVDLDAIRINALNIA